MTCKTLLIIVLVDAGATVMLAGALLWRRWFLKRSLKRYLETR